MSERLAPAPNADLATVLRNPLGAFFTAAMNDKYAEEILGIDGAENSIAGIFGLGTAATTDPDGFNHETYQPTQDG